VLIIAAFVIVFLLYRMVDLLERIAATVERIDARDLAKVAEMNVLPFHPDPRLAATAAPFAIASVALALGLLLRRVVNRFLGEGDPRRRLLAQAMLYGGLFVVLVASVWLRHRG
jgi:hypothetical protein